MPPTRWPAPRKGTSGGRIAPPVQRLVATPYRAPTGEGAMILMTARLRDQWHSMTRTGRVPRLSFDPGLVRGTCFAPMHWTAAFSPRARINAAVTPVVDPISAQPELKHTPGHAIAGSDPDAFASLVTTLGEGEPTLALHPVPPASTTPSGSATARWRRCSFSVRAIACRCANG